MHPSLKKYAAVKITEKPRHHHHKDFMASVNTPVHDELATGRSRYGGGLMTFADVCKDGAVDSVSPLSRR